MTRDEYIANIKLLNHYTLLYDQSTPEISDEAWDKLYFDCVKFENETGYIDPKSPSATIQYDNVTALKKVTHNHLMLSLAKTKDLKELSAWVNRWATIVMFKMDGLTCSLKYVNGKLVSGETRGNGRVGEDVTANIMTLPSVPKTINYPGELIVDGEIICKYDDFEEFSDSFKNPRNFASGSIRLMDSKECAKRKLTFVAWDMITGEDNLSTKLDNLKKLGFVTVYYELVTTSQLEDQQNRMKQLAAKLNYPIDGLVYKINDYKTYMSLGYNEHDFAGGLAFKFYDQLFETELLDIDWSVGKTGAITPIAIFKPVYIDGSTVQKASMHNVTIMRELLGDNPHKGQKVFVFKANMIIPQIHHAEK